jgi:DNA replication protein DnaC
MVMDGLAGDCAEPTPKKIAGILSNAQLPARYLTASFDTFTNFSGNGRQVAARMQKWAQSFQFFDAIRFADWRFGRHRENISSRGPGQGPRGPRYSVCFADFFQLLSELKAGYSDGKADPQMMAPLMNCDVLIIDELGKGRNTEWEKTVADTLIAGRYNQRRVVVASTNYALTAESGATLSFNVDLERSVAPRSDFSPDVFSARWKPASAVEFFRDCARPWSSPS